MPTYLLYRNDLETIKPDEQEPHKKIIDLMTEGMHLVREKTREDVRISHAKAFGLLRRTRRQMPIWLFIWRKGSSHSRVLTRSWSRLAAYRVLAQRRVSENNKSAAEIENIAAMPSSLLNCWN